jgi:hypothetical protein
MRRMSQVMDVGLRPLRVFAPVLLVAGVGMLLAAVVVVLHGMTAQLSTVASAPAGQPMSLSAEPGASPATVHVLARRGPLSFTTADACSVSPHHSGVQVQLDAWPRTVSHDGTTYRSFRTVSGWRAGDTLTCTGPHLSDLLVVRDSRMGTLALAALLGFAGAGGTLLGGLGLRARRAGQRDDGPAH